MEGVLQKSSNEEWCILKIFIKTPVVEEVKFLGVIFYRKLFLVPHLKCVKKKKALKSLNILKLIGNTEWGADQKVILHLYRSLVTSKLDYGCMVYGSARKSYLQMLGPVHNQGRRLCHGAFRNSPVGSLYVDAHEPCLGARRAKISLQFASKIWSLCKHSTHDAVFDNKRMEFDAAFAHGVMGRRIVPSWGWTHWSISRSTLV